VKEATINMLIREYEMFFIRENKNISSMYIRFTDIINSLKALDKNNTNSEMVRKILRCSPKSWIPKVTAIKEAKDLNVLLLKELLGSLMTHEMSIKLEGDNEEKEIKKKKVIAFKSSKDESEEDNDDKLALITRRFKILLAKKKFGNKNFKMTQSFETEQNREEITCYKYNKLGHFKSECPRLKKTKEYSKKKKSMIANVT
ncbi:zf-CCHC domain-containing protein/UBN2 domain-containing protein, partial [Cephalotus follicularis]